MNRPTLHVPYLCVKRSPRYVPLWLGQAMGLELARVHGPDLILLDVHLPDMDGHEVLRQLRGCLTWAILPSGHPRTPSQPQETPHRGQDTRLARYSQAPLRCVIMVE